MQTVVGAWSVAGTPGMPVGGGIPFSDSSVTWKVFRTGRTARIDDYTGLEGELPERLRALGILSAVAAPITVNGNLWGTVVAASSEPNGLPAVTEQRIADFAELVSDALASADAREQLAASRARIVEAADAERRRIERNLHDGAQQRLVSLALALRSAEARLRGDRRRDAQSANPLGPFALEPGEVVDASGTPRSEDLPGRRVVAERYLATDRRARRAGHAPGADHRLCAFGLEAREVGATDVEHPTDLGADTGEHLKRLGAARDERRDPAQCSLLPYERPQPRERFDLPRRLTITPLRHLNALSRSFG